MHEMLERDTNREVAGGSAGPTATTAQVALLAVPEARDGGKCCALAML